MNEQEMAVKLTEVEERSKSNTHRIDKLVQRQDDLDKIATAVEVLASREQSVETDVKEIKSNVKELTTRSGKRWESLADKVIAVLAGAFVAWVLSGGVGV